MENFKITNKIKSIYKTINRQNTNQIGKNLAMISLFFEILSMYLIYVHIPIKFMKTNIAIIFILSYVCWGIGVAFFKISKRAGYNGRILRGVYHCIFIQFIVGVSLIILASVLYLVTFENYDFVKEWANWKDIYYYSQNHIHDWPSQALHNIYLLLATIFGIAFSQLIITLRRKNKIDGRQVFLWFSVIGTVIFGGIAWYYMFSKTSDELYAFTTLCKQVRFYPTDDAKIYWYCFASRIYRFLSVVLVSSYILILLSIKVKKIPGKIVLGMMAGTIIAYGAVSFIYSQKKEAYWNDYVSKYYIGRTIDEYFHIGE